MGGMLGREHPRALSQGKEIIPEKEEVVSTDPEVTEESEQKTGYIDISDRELESSTIATFTIEDSEDTRIDKAIAFGTKYILQDSSSDIGPVKKEEYFNALLDALQMQCSFEDGSVRIQFHDGSEITFSSEITEFEVDITDAVTLSKIEDGSYKTEADNLKLTSMDLSGFGFLKVEHVEIHLINTKASDESEASVKVLSQKKYIKAYLPSNEKIILFDDSIKMLSGWIEGNDISYQVVLSADTTNSLYKSFAIQQLYSTVAPKSFYDLRRVALCAKEIGGEYVLGRVFGSRSKSEVPSVSEVLSLSKNVSGDATAKFFNGKFIIDSSAVSSANSRAVFYITLEGSYLEETVVFEGLCGSSGEKVEALTYDARIAYPYSKEMEEVRLQANAFSANLFSFYSLVLGFQNANAALNLDPAIVMFQLAMQMMTRGLSCFAGTGNMSMAIHILYEQLKNIIKPSMGNINFIKLMEVIDETAVLLSRTQTKIPKEQRKDIGKYMTQAIKYKPLYTSQAFYPMKFLCVFILLPYDDSFDLPRGFPINAASQDIDILEGALADDSILTDMKTAMMHKAMENYITVTNLKDVLNLHLKEDIKEYATRFYSKAPRVISSPTGVHNEFYSLDEPGFGLSNRKDAPLVANENNEFVREWNKTKSLVLNSVSRLSRMYPLANKYGEEANIYIETNSKFHKKTLYRDRISVLKELDYSIVTAGKSIDVDIVRPADTITLVLHKKEENHDM